ncbi:MAG TPA: hypothetical protein VGE92_12015 [Steroidobacteraceae bacterium]
MRLIVCFIPLLWGCSAPSVRCDAHLQPINAPAAAGTSSHPAPAAAPARRTR